VDNDATLEWLAQRPSPTPRPGADIVAPSDMMDGRVAAIRAASTNPASTNPHPLLRRQVRQGFYGPFREAAESAPQFGDRRTYQMDPANAREALREIDLDLDEGADMIMVKPAGPTSTSSAWPATASTSRSPPTRSPASSP
jgi:porphobilinogen synthase